MEDDVADQALQQNGENLGNLSSVTPLSAVDRLRQHIDSTPSAWDRAAARTRQSVKPAGGRQEGWLTENPDFGLVVPKTPLDVAALATAGPFGKAAKTAALAAGAALTGSDAIAGPVGKIVSAGGSALERLSKTITEGIRAYHSSPHDFDKFDMSKIGTGEGNQVYGHGLYFAENPSVSGLGGEYWKKFVSHLPLEEQLPARMLQRGGMDRDVAIKHAKSELEQFRHMYNPALIAAHEDAIRRLESGASVGPRTYEVNINAKPEQFLDWDKPLAKQPHVDAPIYDLLRSNGMTTAEANYILNNKTGRDALRRIDRPDFPIRDSATTPWRASGAKSFDDALALVGGDKSRAMTMLTPDAAYASGALRERGIPGIKYLDQGSRGRPIDMIEPQIQAYQKRLDSGNLGSFERADIQRGLDDLLAEKARVEKGSSNYVLFDDKIIDIRRKYGIATGASVPPAMSALMQQMARSPADEAQAANNDNKSRLSAMGSQ